MIIPRQCDECQETYQAETRYLNRNQGRFCSRKCSSTNNAIARSRKKEHNASCAFCGNTFYKSPSKLTASKSGLVFCSRAHKDSAQRLGGIEQIMPSHYGTGLVPEYRKKAFRNFPIECRVCGWKEFPEVLEVNHKNLNRSDNSLENLEILCPTHHQVFHFLDRSGRWANCN